MGQIEPWYGSFRDDRFYIVAKDNLLTPGTIDIIFITMDNIFFFESYNLFL